VEIGICRWSAGKPDGGLSAQQRSDSLRGCLHALLFWFEEAAVARIAGVDLPRNKKMGIAMSYLYGVGMVNGLQILAKAKIDPNKRTDDVSEEEIARIRDVLENGYKVEGDLRRDVAMNIKRLMDLGCYRGLRHRKGLPVRGQRTHTNARTRKGPRKSVARKSAAPAK
jgi:small subunit ribosomal protein S13